MADEEQLKDPWLVATWPGMGNVGSIAGGYLIDKLGAKPVGEFAAREVFDLQNVEVKGGIARAGRLPRSMLFEWKDPERRHDLIIFVGEAQPPSGGFAFCHKLMEYAAGRGVQRVFTFAAMATQLHPTDDPRAFAATTHADVLQELKQQDVEILKDGQISGLNGVLLAAAAERQIPGVCLLGELPYFAVGVPNPKASQAVLKAFAEMSGTTIDFSSLAEQSDAVGQALLQLLDKLQEAAEGEEGEEGFNLPEFAQRDEPAGDPGGEEAADEDEPEEPELDLAARQRIESLFERARQDRSKAFELKRELDRLGVFDQYEDRFLDLFKKAE